jgi:hypothetical protein
MGVPSSSTIFQYVHCLSCNGLVRSSLFRCAYCGQHLTGREKPFDGTSVGSDRKPAPQSLKSIKRQGTDKWILLLTVCLVLLIAIRILSWLA